MKTSKFLRATLSFYLSLPIALTFLIPMLSYVLPITIASLLAKESIGFLGFSVYLDTGDSWRVCVIVGLIIFIAGLIVLISSVIKMALLKKRTSHTDVLLTEGLYKYIRHPQNLGIVLIFVSLSLIAKSGLSVIYFPTLISWSIFISLHRIASIIEEKSLLYKFGDDYWRYMQNTGLFFPYGGGIPKKHPYSAKNAKCYFKYEILWSHLLLIASFIIIFDLGLVVLHFAPIQVVPSGNAVKKGMEWIAILVYLLPLLVISLLVYIFLRIKDANQKKRNQNGQVPKNNFDPKEKDIPKTNIQGNIPKQKLSTKNPIAKEFLRKSLILVAVLSICTVSCVFL